MKYKKGDQTSKMESLPEVKFNLVADGDSEGIWAGQAEDHVVLLNHALCFFPFPSWGVVLSSGNPAGNLREKIDVTELRGESPDNTTLTLHPDAWAQYLEHGIIDEEGNLTPKFEENEEAAS